MDDDPNKLIKDLFAAVEEKSGGKLTPNQLSRISLKLGEMLGNPGSQEVTQNEKGEILNEEGLPVIEITEQVQPGQASVSNNIAPPFSADLPTWKLSEEEKAKHRAEREQILDTLEQEERIEEERKAFEEEESRAAKKKRLQAARELQKAMGRTLVKNFRDFKAKEEQAKNALLEVDATAGAKESTRLKPKKSVSFDLPPEESPVSPGPQHDWGDVTPARLQPKRPSSPGVHGPMKFRVVERFPHKLQLGSSPKDSDDESDPEPVPDSEGENSDPTKQVEFHSDESTEDGGDLEFQEGEVDLDAAQHQREIALAYYEKREKFVAQAAAAFSSHSHVDEDAWDRPEVPLEASLTGDRPKPAISKFKADRIVSSSTSLDGLVVPESRSAFVRDAVKLGKLESGQLIGRPEDSDDDLKEITKLIGQGEIENIGPSLPNGLFSQATDQVFPPLPPPKARNESSRFRINRGGTSRPARPATENIPSLNVEPLTPVVTNVTERRGAPGLQLEPSGPTCSTSLSPVPDTPPTAAERSSPKLPSEDIPGATLLSDPAESFQSVASIFVPPPPVSGTAHGRTPGTSKTQSPVVVQSPSFKHLPSMIIDSPSFAPSKGHGPTSSSIIIDSPDFSGAATMPSMVIESPDFPSNVVSPTSSATSANNPTSFMIDRVYSPRSPRVMSGQVVERSLVGVNQPRQDDPGKKVSRFAAERR